VRGTVVAIALIGCHGDEPPIERLPSPIGSAEVRALSSPPTLRTPPPPPPPPKGGPVAPPAAVAALAHRERCRVTLDGSAQTAARSADFVDHLNQYGAWVDGFTGCVSNAPDTIAIDCGGGAAIVITDSCNNVFDANGAQIGTFSPDMEQYFRGCL
jgi:hypothetical protein